MEGRPGFEYDTEYGRVTDIYMFPIGTVFRVANGMWEGEVVKYDGGRGIYIPEGDNVIALDENRDYGLVISKLHLPDDDVSSIFDTYSYHPWKSERLGKQKPPTLSRKMQRVKIDKILADNEEQTESLKVDFYQEHIYWLIEQVSKIQWREVKLRLGSIGFHIDAADSYESKVAFYNNHVDWLVEHAEIVELECRA